MTILSNAYQNQETFSIDDHVNAIEQLRKIPKNNLIDKAPDDFERNQKEDNIMTTPITHSNTVQPKIIAKDIVYPLSDPIKNNEMNLGTVSKSFKSADELIASLDKPWWEKK